MEQIQVRVPQGASPGDVIAIPVNGTGEDTVTARITLPPEANPGQVLTVNVPKSTGPGRDNDPPQDQKDSAAQEHAQVVQGTSIDAGVLGAPMVVRGTSMNRNTSIDVGVVQGAPMVVRGTSMDMPAGQQIDRHELAIDVEEHQAASNVKRPSLDEANANPELRRKLSAVSNFDPSEYPNGDADVVRATLNSGLKFADMVLVVWKKKSCVFTCDMSVVGPALFRMIDSDGSGSLTHDEIHSAMDTESVQTLIKSVKCPILRRLISDNPQMRRSAIQALDRNGSGDVDFAEFSAFLANIQQERLDFYRKTFLLKDLCYAGLTTTMTTVAFHPVHFYLFELSTEWLAVVSNPFLFPNTPP
jgi:hypothetical protein